MLIVKAKIKSAVPGMSVSADVPEALNRRVDQLIKDAAERAKANGRKTLMAKDF
jgi:histone H3/H4